MKVKYLAVSRRRSGESGAALLIALGFLALMTLVGIAFVSTSLFSQKLAANSGSRSQTRILARSAAARAAFNMMLCFDQATVDSLVLKNLNAASSYDAVPYNNNGTKATGTLDDQLKSTTNCTVTKLDYNTGSTEYSGDKSSAKWLYCYDTPEGTAARRIIGRVAFQVLPEQSADLSLYGVMGGSVIENDLGVIPQTFRWGRGIGELFYNSSAVLAGCDPPDADHVPDTFDKLYNQFSGFDDAKKKWVEEWFAEGRNSIDREVFPTRDASDASGKKLLYFNRFNIGDFYYTQAERDAKDNWYDRFGWTNAANKKNQPPAVEALSGAALESNDDDTSDVYLAGYGLPFLRRIGNAAHSFPSLELLRRQIVANFNDYCDTDSVPTSDVPAASWSVTDSAKFPTYTGNEKSLYINEVGVEIGAPVLSFSGEKLTVESLPARLVGEAVNMYDNSSGDALLDPTKVALTLGLKKLSFNIGLYCRYTGKVTYKVTSHGMTSTYTKNFTAEVNSGYTDANAAAKVVFAPANAVTGTVTLSALSGGYAAGAASAIALEDYTTSPGDYFKTKIREAAETEATGSGGTYESHQMTDVQVGYKLLGDANSKVEFTPALLRAGSDNTGLDFVRFDRTGAMKLESVSAAVGMSKATLIYSQGGDRKWRFSDTQYVCGIEARDPRQNLNPDYSDDYSHPATSDWNLVPRIVSWNSHPSMTVSANTGSDKNVRPYKVTGGKINRGAVPSAPKYLNASGAEVAVTEVDTETAADPAWLGTNAGQHVSTAYIRNSPMVSAWELGLIHRGREWQTLNLKKAGGFDGAASISLDNMKDSYNWTGSGTDYAKGDGAILDFVKLGVNCRSMGKLQLKQLSSDAITRSGVTPAYSRDLVKMLFDKIRVGQTMKDFYTDTAFGSTPATPTGGSAVSTPAAATTAFVSAVDSLAGDSFALRSQFLNTAYGQSGTTFGLAQSANDALQEELIGKTANLLTVGGNTAGNIFRVLIVAQSIKDGGGVSVDVPMIKRGADGTNKTLGCRIGRFDFISDAADWRNNLYFDEITGETKALVTIERVPATDGATPNSNYGQLVVTSIEFL